MFELIRLIERLSQFAVVPLLAVLVISALAITVVHNWRVALPAMVAHYVAVAALLVRVIDPTVVLIQLLAGGLTCIALGLAALGADNAQRAAGAPSAAQRLAQPNWTQVPAQLTLRALAALLTGTAAIGASIRFPLPSVPPLFTLSAYVLFSLGVLIIATSFEVLNIGLGVLLMLSAFKIAFISLEPSVSVGILLGTITLLVGTAVSFLTLAEGGKESVSLTPATEPPEPRA
ncbi:MAG: hypothetical protein RMJ86_08870 [Anaerolineae bacterium]|nr:hypothetical protein [Thermoflexales bacterium]MDW8054644.1 hypothetical protein [Anaerolineae bacterium]